MRRDGLFALVLGDRIVGDHQRAAGLSDAAFFEENAGDEEAC